MNTPPKKVRKRVSIATIAAFALSMVMVGFAAPATATPQPPTDQCVIKVVHHDEESHQERKYSQATPGKDATSHTEYRYQTRTKVYGEIEHKYIKSKYDFVDGGTTKVNGQTVSGHWVDSGSTTWHAIPDSVINAVWGSGGVPSQYIGGSESNPKGSVQLTMYGGPNVTVPYYAAVSQTDAGYTAWGPWSGWSTTNPGASNDTRNVESKSVSDNNAVPAKTVYYLPGGGQSDTNTAANWTTETPSAPWTQIEERKVVDKAAWDEKVYGPCPPTVEVCTTQNSYVVTNLNEQGFNYTPTGTPYADTRPGADYDYVEGALKTTTTTSASKLQGARAVDIPILKYGGSFAMDFEFTSGTIEPGINIVIDRDNNGTNDVTLVAEPNVAGYLTFWTNTPGYLPASTGGQGGAYAGDQSDLAELWPDAHVKVEKFSLGSGVVTDGKIISWSTPCNTYTYDFKTVIVTPTPNGSVTAECVAAPGTGSRALIEASNPKPTAENTETTAATITVIVDGVSTDVTLQPGETYSSEPLFAEDSGIHSVRLLYGETVLAEDNNIRSDCAKNEVKGNPTSSAVQKCLATGGSEVTYTFTFPAVETTENEFVNPVTFVYPDANGVQQEIVMNAGDKPVVVTVKYPEDANKGEVSVEYGVKGQDLTKLTIDTNCTEPPKVTPPPPGGIQTDALQQTAAFVDQLSPVAKLFIGFILFAGVAGGIAAAVWYRRKTTTSPTA